MVILRRILSKLIHFTYTLIGRLLPEKGKVLMFHSIGGSKTDFNISVEHFTQILQELKKDNIVKLEDWQSCHSPFVAISFDDVPENFYHNAFPLLKEYDIPFTLFVNTSLLDKDGFITTAQLKEMASCELCTIGSHGELHDEYQKFSASEALNDLRRSKAKLENIIGKPVDLYAFPYGSYYACGYRNKSLVNKVYKYGFGTVQIPFTTPLLLPYYFLPRINVE